MSVQVCRCWIAPPAHTTHMSHLDLQTTTHPVYSFCTKSLSGVSVSDQHRKSIQFWTLTLQIFLHPSSPQNVQTSTPSATPPPAKQRKTFHPVYSSSEQTWFDVPVCLCCSNITSQQNKTQKVDPVLDTYPSNLATSHKSLEHTKQQSYIINSSCAQAWFYVSIWTRSHHAPTKHRTQTRKKLSAYLSSIVTPEGFSVWSSIYYLCSPAH